MCYFRPPLPEQFFEPLADIPNCIFASNPCRLQYGAQEIVILRDDIVEKMCRNCIRMPSDQQTITAHVRIMFI